jgi:ATP-dependent Clp protease ATP-binding subunit ClpA
MMNPAFREALEALKQTAEGVAMANQGVQRMADALLHANSEHNDLRETIERLEHLVIGQGDTIKALADEIRKLRDDTHGGR